MKKSVLIVILALLTLVSGCSIQDFLGTQEKDSSEVPNVSRSVDNNEWQEAYYKVLQERYPEDSKQTEFETTHIWLYDINFDDIPEMFLSYLGTVNTVIFLGYSYQDGEVKKIEFEDGSIPSEISLWENKETKERMWIAEGSFKEGPTTYKNISEKVDFSDLAKVKHTIFFEYDEHMALSENLTLTNNLASLYDLYLNDTKMLDLPFERVDEEKTKAFSNYDPIKIQRVFAFATEVTIDETGEIREDNINHNALMKFFRDWSI